MTGEILFVFALLLITIILFVSGLFRLDMVAIMVILALILSGLLSPTAALAGFGDPVVLLIAGLFVVGEALFRTGVAYAIGDWLMRVAGTNENRLLILLMLVVAGLSAFMSLAGAVAIFIPLALNLAAKAGTSPSRLMMPLAASTAFSTPVASPVNTLVLGPGGYQFTDFVKVGVPLQFLAMVVNLLVVPLLFPLQ